MPEETFESDPALTWQASEYLHHQKQPGWYLLLGLGALVLMVYGALTRQWLSIGVFLAMGMALAVYASKSPRVLNYRLDEHGLTVGEKFYPYNQFRSFSLSEDLAWHSIELEPVKRLMPRLSIMFDTQHLDRIAATLAAHMPRVDRKPDLVEQISRRLKF